jgi:hypothetical protein
MFRGTSNTIAIVSVREIAMSSADVNLKIDQPDRMRFAHSPPRALVFAVIAGGFAWLCWHYVSDAPVARYALTGFALLFVIVGVLGFFWRLELDIDLVNRSVRMRRGFWPAAKIRQRRLDEADGVYLRMEYRSSGSKNNRRKVPWWFVSLKFPDEKKGTRIHATASEVVGYQQWERFAKRLQLDAVDATEKGSETRKSWDDLDENLVEQSARGLEAPRRDPNPPPDSGLELIFNRGRKEILIAPLGFNKGLVFLFLFGGIFTALGTFVLLSVLGVIDVPVSGSKAALYIIPPVFILVGIGIVWLGVKGSYSATIIGVANGSLFSENLAFGKRSGRQAIPLANIESVEVAGDVSSKSLRGARVKIGGVPIGHRNYRNRKDEIVVRGDSTILRFGQSLGDTARVWLARACRYAAVNGQLP